MSGHRESALRRLIAAFALLSTLHSGEPAGADWAFHDPKRVRTFAEEFRSSPHVVACRLIERVPEGERFVGTFAVEETLSRKDQPAPTRFRAYCGQDDAIGSIFVGVGALDDELQRPTVIAAEPTTIEYAKRVLVRPKTFEARCAALFADLENPDEAIADDIVREMYRISYSGLGKVRSDLPHAKLLQWIVDERIPNRRRDQYFRLLSICGSADDLPLLKSLIEKRARKELGERDAIIAGPTAAYLAIRGEAGIPWVIDRLRGYAMEKDLHACLNGLEAVRRVEFNIAVVPKERFVGAYRALIESPYAHEVLPDLERLKDWDSLSLWTNAYDGARTIAERRNRFATTISFLQICPLPEAKRKLEELRQADAKAYDECVLQMALDRAEACAPPGKPGTPRMPW
jgi:hypothetical protein